MFLINLEKNLIRDFNNILRMEEDFWKLNSRITWLNEDDAKIKKFHTSTSIRRSKYKIVSLKLDNNSYINEQSDIVNHILDFFKDLFKSNHHKSFRVVVPKAKVCLSEIDKLDLGRVPSENEVREAVFSFQPFKAPDGLHPYIYLKYWYIVSQSVFSFCNRAFMESKINPSTKSTHICRIPKSPNAQTLKSYRPISLCNTSYKIFMKIISRRLHPIMDKIIEPYQTNFLKNRQATDNVIVIQEIIRHFKKMKGKKGNVITKIYLKKGFDKME